MRRYGMFAALMLSSFLLSGCGGKGTSNAEPAKSPKVEMTEIVITDKNGHQRVFESTSEYEAYLREQEEEQ